MKKILKSVLITCLIIPLFSTTVFAAGEKPLIDDSTKLHASYGYGLAISSNEHQIVDAIRKTGKTDFDNGIYAYFRKWGLDEYGNDIGPGSSDVFLELNDFEGYNQLVFDIISLDQDKFGELEPYIKWNLIESFSDYSQYETYDEYKKNFKYPDNNNGKFNVEKLNGKNPFDLPGEIQVTIAEKKENWDYKYTITVSKEWETVKVDISDLDNFNLSFNIQGNRSVLVANPRFINSNVSTPIKEDAKVKAIPSNSLVSVNNKQVSFDAYNINQNNYFKLRDIAKVVSGSKKQFEVTWDNEKKAIDLVSNKSYTETGDELVPGDGTAKTSVKNTADIYKDGELIDLESYTINNNNYFKLRDIAKVFDIEVGWNEETNTVTIDTNLDY